MEIYKLLYPQQSSADRDKGTFNNWADGVITTEMAISDFKWNNHIDEDVIINKNDFIEWLRSLGYWR